LIGYNDLIDYYDLTDYYEMIEYSYYEIDYIKY